LEGWKVGREEGGRKKKISFPSFPLPTFLKKRYGKLRIKGFEKGRKKRSFLSVFPPSILPNFPFSSTLPFDKK